MFTQGAQFKTALMMLILVLSSTSYATKVVGNRVLDMQGNVLQLGLDGTVLKPIVLSFINQECTQDIESLNQVSRHAKSNGFVFYGIAIGQSATWESTLNLVKKHNLAFPVILDADRNLFNELKPSVTPEGFIVNKFDKVLYQGSVEPTHIAAAINSVKAGKPAVSKKQTSGCEVKLSAIPKKITYNQHLSPLIQANCVECHKPKGIAPFPLIGYEASRNFAPMISYVTKKRIMPPWQATPGSGQYLNERLLSEHQIELLEAWSKTGVAEGPDKSKVPEIKLDTSEWRLGEPDIIISMEEAFDVPASGPDIYRYFVVKDAIPNDLEIAAIDFIPGDASVVHHSNFFVDYGKKARKKDAEDPGIGFSVFGSGGFFSYWDSDNTAAGMGAWAPGGNPIRYPDGMGMQLPGGADFVFEIHYHPTGKKARDKSRLGIYLAKKPIKKAVSSVFIGTNQLHIPAGVKNYKRHFWMELPTEMTIVDIAPHMHYLGTHANIIARYPNGKVQTLLDSRWDFRWQGAYYFREPVVLPKGTRIETTTTYDNSSDNPYNPYDPPVTATWGWGTDQEMGEIYVTILADDQDKLQLLQEAAQASWSRPSDPEFSTGTLSTKVAIVRLRELSTWEPDGESLLRLIASDTKRLKEANRLIKSMLSTNPKDAKLLTVKGSLAAIQSQITESTFSQYSLIYDASNAYEEALKIDPGIWDARYGLANGSMEDESYHDYAIEQFNELIRQQEKQSKPREIFAKAYIDLGDLYKRKGRLSKAKEIWIQGQKYHPRNQHLVERLGLSKKAR